MNNDRPVWYAIRIYGDHNESVSDKLGALITALENGSYTYFSDYYDTVFVPANEADDVERILVVMDKDDFEFV